MQFFLRDFLLGLCFLFFHSFFFFFSNSTYLLNQPANGCCCSMSMSMQLCLGSLCGGDYLSFFFFFCDGEKKTNNTKAWSSGIYTVPLPTLTPHIYLLTHEIFISPLLAKGGGQLEDLWWMGGWFGDLGGVGGCRAVQKSCSPDKQPVIGR